MTLLDFQPALTSLIASMSRRTERASKPGQYSSCTLADAPINIGWSAHIYSSLIGTRGLTDYISL